MKYRVRLRDKIYEVEVERGEAIVTDEYAATKTVPTVKAAAPKPSAPSVTDTQGNTVHAPLPGSVIDVKVQVGDRVKRGQVLLLVEAMKMENEIVAPEDGTVKAVHTSKGASVATGDALVTLG